MNLSREAAFSALFALNDQLAVSGYGCIEIVVCGGSALQALSLVDRTTRDVDILAFISRDEINIPKLESAEPFPEVLQEAIITVARDMRLPNDWLNYGPTSLLSQGLPDGLLERLETKRMGSHLIVHYISRFDQICFKMYAAINGGGERHLSDLYKLDPNEEELFNASTWCLTQDASDYFPIIVKDFLRKVGYPNVANRL
jgi:hypothetical protein